MNRRSLFQLAVGLLAAPLACLAKPKTQTFTFTIPGPDADMVAAMLPKLKAEVTKALREGMQRNLLTWQQAYQDKVSKPRHCIIYNIHNNGYRILGEKPQVTHFDEP